MKRLILLILILFSFGSAISQTRQTTGIVTDKNSGKPLTGVTVRKRAALPGHEVDMMITPGEVNIDLILNERARELAGEYHRWFDLKRTGKLIEYTKKYTIAI